MFNLISVRNRHCSFRTSDNIPCFNTEHSFFKNSFFPSTIVEWNKLDVSLRKCDSLNVFKKEILKFMRPYSNSLYNCRNPIRVKYIIRTRLGLNHLREHKLKHSFQDSINPIRNCGHDVAGTRHSLSILMPGECLFFVHVCFTCKSSLYIYLNGNNRFITDNRKTREKYKQGLNRTKETVTTVKSNNILTEDKQQGNENGKSYAEAVKYSRMNISNERLICLKSRTSCLRMNQIILLKYIFFLLKFVLLQPVLQLHQIL